MRFATRLTIVMAALAVASAIALSWIVSNVLDRAVEERARERLLRESAWLVTEINNIDIRRAASELGVRITVIRSDGLVVNDSGVAPGRVAEMENHAMRPEVIEAGRSGVGWSVRHSATLGRDLFYLARRSGDEIVRLALPYDELRHIESQYEWGARAAIVFVCALLFVTGSVALRTMSRPIRRLSETLQPMESGPVEIMELSWAIQHMKQGLLEAAARIERERQLGATVFETLPDGTVIIDRRWRIVDANPRFKQLLRSSCLPGQPLIDIVRDRDLFAPFEEAVKNGTSAHATVERGGDVAWEVSVHPLSGGDAAAVGIIHDVTPFRQNESMRRRFVADISHELRTPVASIAAAAEALAVGMSVRAAETARNPLRNDDTRSAGGGSFGVSAPQDDKQLVDVIARQAGRMRELLDDLTDLTLIESGQVGLQRTRVDLAEVAREVANDVQPGAVSIVVSGGGVVEGDRRRIAQIIRNLIDNAIKFSSPGSTVRVGIEDNVLSVTDSGEGIPARELSRIFQRFYQVDRSRSKIRPGSGLGLAIVKHLAQLHGATVDVESAVGVGSTFRVRFPLQEE